MLNEIKTLLRFWQIQRSTEEKIIYYTTFDRNKNGELLLKKLECITNGRFIN